jgi:hypothetical protein
MLVFALALLLRARRLRQKGLFLWDEAAFVREMRVAFRTFGFLFGNWSELWAARHSTDKDIRDELHKKYREQVTEDYVYYKPWHMYALRLGVALSRQMDFAVVIPSLVFGMSALVAVCALGTVLQGSEAGVLGAAVLAVSGMHVMHSRSAEPEPGTGLCFTLMLLCSLAHKAGLGAGGAAYLWSAPSVALLAGCGVFLAGTVLFNPGWIALPPPVFLMGEIVYGVASGGGAVAPVVSIGIIAAAAAATVLISDIPFILSARLVPKINLVPHSVKLIQMVSFLLKGFLARRGAEGDSEDELGVALPRFYHLRFYLDLLRHTEGAVVLAAAVAGIVLAFARHTPAGLMLGVQIVIILGMLVVVPQKAARACVFWMPLFSLFAGLALAQVPVWLGLPVLAWILVRGFAYCWRIGSLTSAMRLSAEFIRARGDQGFATTSAPFTLLYSNSRPVAPRDYSFVCHLHYQQKLRYIVLDHHQHFPGMKWDETQDLIQQHCGSVYEVEDPCATFFPLRMETEIYMRSAVYKEGPIDVAPWNRFRMDPCEKDRRVRVYDLSEFFSKIESPGIFEYVNLFLARDKFEKSQYEEAMLHLRFAEKHGLREDSRVKYYIALCHGKMGKEDWALRIMNRLVEDPATREEVRNGALIYIYMGIIHEKMRTNDFEAARAHAHKVLEVNPSHMTARLFDAICVFHLQGPTAGRVGLLKLVRDPEFPDSHKDRIREFAQVNGINLK